MDSGKFDSSTSSSSTLKVETVYEWASDISEHFKVLLQQTELPERDTLISCVAQVLVHLEEVVLERDNYQLLVEKLSQQFEELKKESNERIEQQKKYFSDIEDIDETWRKENSQLSQYVQLLKKENHRLSSSLKSGDKCYHSLTDLKNDTSSEKSDDEDVERTRDFKQSEIDKLNNELRRKYKEVDTKNDEILALKTHNDNLVKENQNLQVMLALLRSAKEVNKSRPPVNATSCTTKIELKMRIMKLEAELEKLKQQQDCDVHPEEQAIDNQAPERAIEVDDKFYDDCAPVQGPIPKEPDEKLYPHSSPNRSSRIWSFFKFFRK